jgi:hypothetical protein
MMAMKTGLTVAVMMGVLAGQVQAGYQITIKSVSEGDKKGRQAQAQGGNNTMVFAADADKARIDFIEGHAPGGGKDGYLITKDAGKSFTMVSPKDKTYMKWDMDAMMGMAGAMGNMMKMQVSNPKVEKLLDEAGESLLGYPTRHYKTRTAYHMSMTVMGFKNEMDIVKEDESWTTPKLDISTLGAWFNQMPKTQNEELDKLVQAEKGKMTGMPLKMLSVQTSTDSQGKASVTRSSMVVTDIKKIGASEVSVEIPEDYKELDLLQAAGQEPETGTPRKTRRSQAPAGLDFNTLMKKAMQSAE